jgi:hypothetical protein
VPHPETPSDFGRNARIIEHNWIAIAHEMFASTVVGRYASFPDLLMSEAYKDFVRALCFNRSMISQGPPNETEVLALRYAIFQLQAMDDREIENGRVLEDVWDEYELYRRCLVLGLPFRYRFCFLNGGEAGWVPCGARTGDTVFVFNGAVVPYLLRPQEDGTYVWVGECWVQGVMNSEALELQIDVETISIR